MGEGRLPGALSARLHALGVSVEGSGIAVRVCALSLAPAPTCPGSEKPNLSSAWTSQQAGLPETQSVAPSADSAHFSCKINAAV